MSRPTITLTTDFGMRDHFVAVLKGVIRQICPAADIIDVTHEITPFEINEAAFVIAETYPYYPPGTIHVVVVDPGVGTTRRPLLVEAAGHCFVAPDNGVLSSLLAQQEGRARELTNSRLFRPTISQTFHGRDIFAPIAAHLAAGVSPADCGPEIFDALVSTTLAPVQTARRVWTGSVRKVDRFGNLITNFSFAAFPDLRRRSFDVALGFEKLSGLTRSYAEKPIGELLLIEGSSGYLEVAANQASAQKILGVGLGAPLEVTFAKSDDA